MMGVALGLKFSNGPVFKAAMAKAAKNMSGVTAYTLTGCAFDSRQKLQNTMKSYLDKPTPATIRGVYYKKAKPSPHPFSEVSFSPLAWKWMKYSVIGGVRSGGTLSAPVAARKNAYGNVVGSQRASKLITRPGYFRKEMGGVDGLWQRVGRGLSLQHVYKTSMRYSKRLPMQSIVYKEAAKVFPILFKKNVEKALKKSVGF
jgi:hypothetical protein